MMIADTYDNREDAYYGGMADALDWLVARDIMSQEERNAAYRQMQWPDAHGPEEPDEADTALDLCPDCGHLRALALDDKGALVCADCALRGEDDEDEGCEECGHGDGFHAPTCSRVA